MVLYPHDIGPCWSCSDEKWRRGQHLLVVVAVKPGVVVGAPRREKGRKEHFFKANRGGIEGGRGEQQEHGALE